MLNLVALLPQNLCYYHKLFWRPVFAPVYIDITADTSHSSTRSLCIAQLITSFGTLSKAFSKSTKQNQKSFLPVILLHLSCHNKKLSYRRGTARCIVSIEILPIATQKGRNYLYDNSWPNRWYEVGDLVGGNAWSTMCTQPWRDRVGCHCLKWHKKTDDVELCI